MLFFNMERLAVLMTFFATVLGATTCPGYISCKSTLAPDSCPTGTVYREQVRSFNCCPGCVPVKGIGQQCRKNEECAPGLFCPQETAVCTKDPTQSCEAYKMDDPIWKEFKYWTPRCLPDGRFASKQCKGDWLTGKCFCATSEGDRIFGEVPWLDAVNMTCACSRLSTKLIKEDPSTSLHCDENGNFENLQCNNKVCWCSNDRTGRPYTQVVPESLVAMLPCFDAQDFGSQYLRRCDSIRVNSHNAVEFLSRHGTENVVLKISKCDLDGSYARIQHDGFLTYCVYKNKRKITNPNGGGVDCNCALDEFVAQTFLNQTFELKCDGAGNYNREQACGNKKFYVDSDGFAYNMTVIRSANVTELDVPSGIHTVHKR